MMARMLGVQGAGAISDPLGGTSGGSPGGPLRGPVEGRGGPLDTTVEVETPEHVRFRYQIAGPGRRAAAYLIDLIVRGLVVLALAIVVGLGFASGLWDVSGFEIGALLVVYFALEWGYYVVSELLMNGASLGKRALRLRVVQGDGLPITFTDSFLRNLVRAADLLPSFYAFGLISMMLDSRFRRLGDLVAGTIVVHEPSTTLRALRGVVRSTPGASQAEAAVLQEAANLPPRAVLSRDERQALALFARRRPMLSPQRAEELAELVAPGFAQRLGVRYQSGAAFLEALHRQVSARGTTAGR